jgi:hypothetical protein
MLTQQEADEFMQAEKVVPGREPMTWTQPSGRKGLATWRAGVEIDGARVGEILCLSNPAVERSWKFLLTYRGEQVYRLEAQNRRCRHHNPHNAPTGFPNRVTEQTHEHVFVEGLDCECARPLPELAASDHAAIFQWFCRRTSVRVEPPYAHHAIPYQMSLL